MKFPIENTLPFRVRARTGQIDDPTGPLHNKFTWQILVHGTDKRGVIIGLLKEINSHELADYDGTYDTQDQAKEASYIEADKVVRILCDSAGIEYSGVFNLKTGKFEHSVIKAPHQ